MVGAQAVARGLVRGRTFLVELGTAFATLRSDSALRVLTAPFRPRSWEMTQGGRRYLMVHERVFAVLAVVAAVVLVLISVASA